MAVPDFQTLMLPVLATLSDGQERSPSLIREFVATQYSLSDRDLSELLPSGRQTTFSNRIAWALAYLKQADLVESPRRGSYRVTERGRHVLSGNPTRIDIEFLKQFPEFQAFRSKIATESASATVAVPATTSLTPDEQIRQGHARLRETMVAQLLERIKQSSPQFFESLVLDVLVAMGYGGSREDAAGVARGSDEGIDGIIKQDPLGLDRVYVQAKRWSGTVGRPEIQRFAGALQGQRARKGVFITTSSFSSEARGCAADLQTTIVLIEGPELADLMLDYGIGVSEAGAFKLWKLDEDYFMDE